MCCFRVEEDFDKFQEDLVQKLFVDEPQPPPNLAPMPHPPAVQEKWYYQDPQVSVFFCVFQKNLMFLMRRVFVNFWISFVYFSIKFCVFLKKILNQMAKF